MASSLSSLLRVPVGVDLLAIGVKAVKAKPVKKPAIDRETVTANLKLFVATHQSQTQISARDFDAWEAKLAPVAAITKLFGGWWPACRSADAYPARVPPNDLTAQLLVETMLAATFDPGCNPRRRPPSLEALTAYSTQTGNPVAYKTYDRIFKKQGLRECWELVLAAGRQAQAEVAPDTDRELTIRHQKETFQITIPTGIDLEEIEQTRGMGWTEAEMLTALRDCADALGKTVISQDDFDAWRGVRGAQQVSKRFGGWEQAMRAAGLTPTTLFNKNISARLLVQHMIDCAADGEVNPSGKAPMRAILGAYGQKIGRPYTHYHYATFFGSIGRCWELIQRWQRGEITEEALLSPSPSKTAFEAIPQPAARRRGTKRQKGQKTQDLVKAYQEAEAALAVAKQALARLGQPQKSPKRTKVKAKSK